MSVRSGGVIHRSALTLLLVGAGLGAGCGVFGGNPLVPSADGYQVLCPTANEEARTSFNTGVQYASAGKIQEAKSAYERALELDPDYCDAMDNLAIVLRRGGKEDEAVEWYQRSLKILPTNPTAHQGLAYLYWRQGRTNQALEWYQKLADLVPDNPEAQFGMGAVYLQSIKSPSKAIPYLQKAEELYAKQSNPFVRDAQYQLGIAYYQTDQVDDAIASLEKAYPSYANDQIANAYLGACYFIKNDLEQAKKYLGKAKSLGAEVNPEVARQLGL